MKTSILVIAHNEEVYIGKCIKSLFSQTERADEIVLIVHNSTDHTEIIARAYPITVVSYSGPMGITYARIEGLRHVSGDIILCIDGDSYAAPNWVEVMRHTLSRNENVLVGSWVKFKGTVFGWWSNLFNKYSCIKRQNVERWIWGSSMAFWGRDTNIVREIFEKSFSLSAQLGLTRNPDDYWLSLFMKRRGKLEVTNKTHVVNHTKEVSTREAMKRSFENVQNGNKIEAFFKKYTHSL